MQAVVIIKHAFFTVFCLNEMIAHIDYVVIVKMAKGTHFMKSTSAQILHLECMSKKCMSKNVGDFFICINKQFHIRNKQQTGRFQDLGRASIQNK